MYRAKLQEQLRARSTENADSGCWEWQGQVSNSGRGRLKLKPDYLSFDDDQAN